MMEWIDLWITNKFDSITHLDITRITRLPCDEYRLEFVIFINYVDACNQNEPKRAKHGSKANYKQREMSPK